MAQTGQTTTTVVVQPPQPTVQTAVVVHRKEGNACRAAIPAMHMAMAVTCLILNIFFPGIGTIVAGFSVFCCANPGQSGMGKFGTMCLNFWVGILQLATTLLFFIGWIWSIMWGAAFIAMSADYHQTNKTTSTLVTSSTPGPQAMVITQTTPQQQQYVVPPQGYNQPQPPHGYTPQLPPPQGYNPAVPAPQVQTHVPPPQQQGYYPVPTQDCPPQQAGYVPPQPQQAYPQQSAYNPHDPNHGQLGAQVQGPPPPYNPHVDPQYPQKY